MKRVGRCSISVVGAMFWGVPTDWEAEDESGDGGPAGPSRESAYCTEGATEAPGIVFIDGIGPGVGEVLATEAGAGGANGAVAVEAGVGCATAAGVGAGGVVAVMGTEGASPTNPPSVA